jgi:CRP/FNR family transcriptional regulator
MEALANSVLRKLYVACELLFAEGEPCAGFYLVLSGRIRIFKTSASGREQVLAIEGPGSSVAELPVFDGGRYPASVAAMESSEMVFISRRDFQAFCLEHPEVALKVLAVVGSRLRRLVGIIEELSFTTVRQRLIAHLLRLANDIGVKSAKGIEITLPGSHQDLANQIGTVRELVSRNLSRLQAEELLEVDARNIVIRDSKRLEALQHEGE